MKIIIEIPDEAYEDVKKAGGCYYDFGKAIVNGIPIPKTGHEWIYSIFDKDMIKAHKERLTKEAEERGMTLIEYLESIDPSKEVEE